MLFSHLGWLIIIPWCHVIRDPDSDSRLSQKYLLFVSMLPGSPGCPCSSVLCISYKLEVRSRGRFSSPVLLTVFSCGHSPVLGGCSWDGHPCPPPARPVQRHLHPNAPRVSPVRLTDGEAVIQSEPLWQECFVMGHMRVFWHLLQRCVLSSISHSWAWVQ